MSKRLPELREGNIQETEHRAKGGRNRTLESHTLPRPTECPGALPHLEFSREWQSQTTKQDAVSVAPSAGLPGEDTLPPLAGGYQSINPVHPKGKKTKTYWTSL